MNSTHAAWLNAAAAILAAILPIISTVPGVPAAAVAAALAVNAALHAILPDAPAGAGVTGSTTPAAKTMLAFLFIGLGLASLNACTSTANPTPVAATGNAAQQVAQICAAAAPLVQEATAKAPAPTSTAGNLLAYAQVSCNVDGTVAATLSPVVVSTTPAWLRDVLTGLQVAAQLAPVILPLVGA